MPDNLRAAAERVVAEALGPAHALAAPTVMASVAASPAFLAWAVREACDLAPCSTTTAGPSGVDYVQHRRPRPDVAAFLDGVGEQD